MTKRVMLTQRISAIHKNETRRIWNQTDWFETCEVYITL